LENIDLEDALNAGTYYPEVTSKLINKFDGKYVHDDMNTMISKEHLNDITLAKFFHHLGKTSNYKPQFKKSGLAAINLGVQYHHLENINAFKLIWSH
jgi:hypothetical protein